MNEIFERYVGMVFDNRYRIERVIGIGGMAVVFKATDLLMRRIVAVKILKDEIASDEQSVKRFTNESRTVAMLSHPNIVNVYDASVRDNVKYIVMEFVEGITLKNYMQHREVLNLREIISYTTQILRALDHAHKKGIVHRDIKPQNIMLLKNGVIKVMDFGIAKRPNSETVTMTDKAIGTVYYISPEQVTGGEIDARSDLYALGAMMYEMATGRLPFTADTPVSVALMQVNETAPQPKEINPHIPAGLDQIITRAMEKDPDARYQSAEEMLGHLLKLRENPKIIFKENKTSKQKQKQKESSVRPRHKTSRTMFPIIMGVTLAFLIVAGISGYYMIDRLFINSVNNDYVDITVENFINSTYEGKLKEWFAGSEQYEMPDITYVYDDTIEAGRIVSQDPHPGETRKVLAGRQECKIAFEISKGPHLITLEDYTVRDYRIVASALRKMSLEVKIENIPSDVYEIGYVIRTYPEAGSIVREGDTVTIFVSEGADAVKTAVPNFVGLSEARAYIVLMENKLDVGTITYEKSDLAAGTVLEQSVEAWTQQVPQYTEIDLVISGGASYAGDGTTVPTEEDMKPAEPEVPETKPEPEKPADETQEDENTDSGSDSSDSSTEDSSEKDDDWFSGNIFKQEGDDDSSSSGMVITGDDFFGSGYEP
ncbi:MAG: protein kinase [Clostridia bacterium]|nr:protein kinase [Clostridia bacterium]